jgi:uncharacterized membrane protein YraQ (UPF0718 family)
MKATKLLKDERIIYLFLASLIVLVVYLVNPTKAAVVTRVAFATLRNVLGLIISVTIFVGLANVWIKPQGIVRLLGKESGFRGLLLSSVVGILLTGPLYIVFPLLKTFREKGARGASIATMITAWGGIRLPLIPLEIHFLGWPFFLLRNTLLFLLTIPVGILVEKTENLLEKIRRGGVQDESFISN